jgi:hypothetical protein
MRLKLTLITALAVAAGVAIPVAVSVSTAQAGTVDPTATGVNCLPESVPMGEATSCTVTVTDSSIGATTPTGTVSFTVVDAQGTFTVGSCTLTAISVIPPPDEQASCSATYTPEQFGPGTQTLTANYLGDSGHAAGSGSEFIEQALRASNMNLTCSPASVFSGQATTCTAALADAGSFDTTTPTGTVSFITGTNKGNFTAVGSCTLAAVVIGQAFCSVSFTPPPQLPLGAQQVAASYGGDSEFSPNGTQIAITVTPGPATLLADLYQAVTTPTPVGPGNSLGSKVQQAQAYYAAGDIADTCSTLGAFINEVAAQTGKKIPATTAAQLTADAQQIQTDLGC